MPNEATTVSAVLKEIFVLGKLFVNLKYLWCKNNLLVQLMSLSYKINLHKYDQIICTSNYFCRQNIIFH